MTGRTLAVIPARGGSKRIPKKNLQEVNGKPLVAHAVEDAEQATSLAETVVSTDSSAIAAVAREYGGNVPFERPAELASDTASVGAVVAHALDWFADRGREFKYVCMLQPTSPLRRGSDIDGALETLADANAESVVSVTRYNQPPQLALTVGEDGYLGSFFDETGLFDGEYVREQDIEEVVYPNGAVYAATVESWRRGVSFFTSATVGFRMPPERSLEVDEPWELELVRAWMEVGSGRDVPSDRE